MEKMHYSVQSGEWKEGLPIGNGRLATMVWGDDKTDILTLNHEWLWRGKNKNRQVQHAADHLQEVRQLLKEGNYFRANLIANLYMGGEGGITLNPCRVDPYQPAGTLEFALDEVEAFQSRELDLMTGVVRVERKTARGNVVSEFFASCENKLLMWKWQGENGFSGKLYQARVEDPGASYHFTAEDNRLVFDCSFEGGISHRVITEIETDGQYVAEGDSIRIENATYVKAITNIATSVFDLEAELARYTFDFSDFPGEKERHINKFSKVMSGVKLHIDEDKELDELTISERLERMREQKRDNQMAVLYFDFGRYLMVSSSICGELPANMQGKWNDEIVPNWDCDYHFDINLEMNYWMAEPCNMPECAEALLGYLESYYESGAKAAKELFGCRGIFLPIQSDAWGNSTPESFGWAVWIGAAPWMAQSFWKHYTYSGDKEFLKNRAYRFFKEVAEFYEDYLEKDENGVYQIMPSQSPENTFEEACGYFYLPVGLCISSAMDVQLAYDALTYAINTARILGIDEERADKWQEMRDHLPGFRIGSDGRLLEWDEGKTERQDELGHRHLSHLYGVFPSDLFTAQTRPKQYEAARKSLEFRLSHGGGHTGWSRAWVSCLQARFGNSAEFYENYIALVRDFATDTLLDLHPPRIFQIDGNLGGVMAVIESILSYTDGKVHLLRALPKEWEKGSLEGIKVPGGHVIDMGWENGKIVKLGVKMGYEEKVVIANINGEEKEFRAKAGEYVSIVERGL